MALQARERGYRGNPLRSVALTDSGTDARRPDPWSVTVATDVDDRTLSDREWVILGGTDRSVAVAEETRSRPPTRRPSVAVLDARRRGGSRSSETGATDESTVVYRARPDARFLASRSSSSRRTPVGVPGG